MDKALKSFTQLIGLLVIVASVADFLYRNFVAGFIH